MSDQETVVPEALINECKNLAQKENKRTTIKHYHLNHRVQKMEGGVELHATIRSNLNGHSCLLTSTKGENIGTTLH